MGEELPSRGFDAGESGFQAPPEDGSDVEVEVDPASERLQLLEPFPAWDGKDLVDLPVLLKATGKCTTDHISAAGPWLRFRGHLENISGNLFLGANNAFTDEPGTGKDVLDGTVKPLPEVAKHYGESGSALGGGGRRELRRGLVPRARRHGAPLPGRRRPSSPARSPASTRPT